MKSSWILACRNLLSSVIVSCGPVRGLTLPVADSVLTTPAKQSHNQDVKHDIDRTLTT